MADPIYSLYDVSAKLGVSPSAIKKRVANLNLPVDRGARGKLLFNQEAYALLQRADEMLKGGAGFEDCRQALGLTLEGAEPAIEADAEVETDAIAAPVEAAEPVAEETPADAPPVEAVAEDALPELVAPVAEAVEEAPELRDESPDAAPAASLEQVVPVADRAADRTLPAPIFIQLGRRKPSESVRLRVVEHQPTPTPMPAQAPAAAPEPVAVAPEPVAVAPMRATTAPVVTVMDPDMVARLDAALKLIEDKDKQNQVLQSKLLVTYDEMTKLSATAAAFQERSMNLQHEVQKLQGEIKLLSAPPTKKPWWKFWG
jgi:hypothetical protein